MARQQKLKQFAPRKVTIKGRGLWQIYVRSEVLPDGRRKPIRKTFADHAEALEYAELLRIQKANHGTAAMTISAKLRDEAVQAEALLRPFGLSLLAVAKKAAAEAAARATSRNTGEAIRDYIQSAISDGRSQRYIADLRSRLGQFGHAFGSSTLASINTTEIEAWLHGLRVGAAARNSSRRRLVAFFNYCSDRGWCPGNPAAKVTVARETQAPIGILTPDELSRLLSNADESTLPYWSIGAFAGIRTAEISRLSWNDVHWDSGLIEISANKSKTAARRFVHMQPALQAWLAPYRNHRGPICPASRSALHKLLVTDRRQAGVTEWPSNALRHSFASYHLTHFKNAAELALEMGHTNSALIFRHYRELTKPEIAKQWWSVMPATENNIVTISA